MAGARSWVRLGSLSGQSAARVQAAQFPTAALSIRSARRRCLAPPPKVDRLSVLHIWTASGPAFDLGSFSGQDCTRQVYCTEEGRPRAPTAPSRVLQPGRRQCQIEAAHNQDGGTAVRRDQREGTGGTDHPTAQDQSAAGRELADRGGPRSSGPCPAHQRAAQMCMESAQAIWNQQQSCRSEELQAAERHFMPQLQQHR
jgi:hypothetical protein